MKMNLPPAVKNALQLITMIVLAFIFGSLILLGANYFDDRPREASIFFALLACVALIKYFWKRAKQRKQIVDESKSSLVEEKRGNEV